MKLKTFFEKIISVTRKSKLRTRLIVSFLMLSLIPGLVLALFANSRYEKSLDNRISESELQTLQLLNNNLVLIFEEYSRYISDVSISKDVQNSLYKRLKGDYPTLAGELNMLDEFVHSSNLRAVKILDARGVSVFDTGWVGNSKDEIDEIIKLTNNASPRDCVTRYSPPYGSDCIAVSRKIYDDHYKNTHVGYIVLMVNPAVIDTQSFPVSYLGDGSYMYILNSNGSLVASQNARNLPDEVYLNTLFSKIGGQKDTGSFTGELPDDEDSLVVYTYNSRYDLYLVSVIPKDTLYKEINSVKSVVLAVTLILSAVCLGILFLLYFSIVKPIDRIVTVCRAREDSEPYIPIGDTAGDELGYLSKEVDAMIQKDIQSIEEIELQDRQKRELEIKNLENQFNPHFLFNTLSTFKWIASLNGLKSLSDGISSLAGLLRSALRKSDEKVTFSNEIENLKSYATIQNLKYAGRFIVSYIVDEAAMECLVPRFLLQPLVENAILHGIRDNDILLNITITGSVSKNCLNISVVDDGTGFDINRVYDSDRDCFSGIGLANVDSRLRLYYGTEHRLIVNSSPGIGTSCHISIPLSDQL